MLLQGRTITLGVMDTDARGVGRSKDIVPSLALCRIRSVSTRFSCGTRLATVWYLFGNRLVLVLQTFAITKRKLQRFANHFVMGI